jgi:uncharacterized protein (TIGR02145 family)
MKKLILFASALCMSVCAMAQSEFYVYKTDGSSVRYMIADVDSISFTAPDNTENGYEWVDLGLSVKWATCNVGTTKPEEYGNYYAWGETTPKSTYDWSTYKWCYGSSTTMTKYCTKSSYGTVDNKTVLDPEDDAAAVNMGGEWRMPTLEEQKELIDECTWIWTDDYNGTGVAGQIVTSKTNDNHIFFPAAGYRYGSDLYGAGSDGYCWSSSLNTVDSDYAFYLYFGSDYVDWSNYRRYYGQSVRGVCP